MRTIKVKPGDLGGLPKDFIDGHPVGADGLITLDINYPDYGPVAYATNDEVRRRLYMEFNNRAKNEDVLKRMLRTRHELATLLGFPHWADYITANKMAGNAKTGSSSTALVSGAAQERATRRCSHARRRTSPAPPRSTRGSPEC